MNYTAIIEALEICGLDSIAEFLESAVLRYMGRNDTKLNALVASVVERNKYIIDMMVAGK